MPPEMFNDICAALAASCRYFRLECDAAGRVRFATVQKVTVALRMLAYGGLADSLDEYIRMGESTVLETVNKFTRAIVAIFGPEYLREPNEQDIARLRAKAEKEGSQGC
jgi:hypothetical protein